MSQTRVSYVLLYVPRIVGGTIGQRNHTTTTESSTTNDNGETRRRLEGDRIETDVLLDSTLLFQIEKSKHANEESSEFYFIQRAAIVNDAIAKDNVSDTDACELGIELLTGIYTFVIDQDLRQKQQQQLSMLGTQQFTHTNASLQAICLSLIFHSYPSTSSSTTVMNQRASTKS